jgi:hypothetical protein
MERQEAAGVSRSQTEDEYRSEEEVGSREKWKQGLTSRTRDVRRLSRSSERRRRLWNSLIPFSAPQFPEPTNASV